jgi:hypothetical protein
MSFSPFPTNRVLCFFRWNTSILGNVYSTSRCEKTPSRKIQSLAKKTTKKHWKKRNKTGGSKLRRLISCFYFAQLMEHILNQLAEHVPDADNKWKPYRKCTSKEVFEVGCCLLWSLVVRLCFLALACSPFICFLVYCLCSQGVV